MSHINSLYIICFIQRERERGHHIGKNEGLFFFALSHINTLYMIHLGGVDDDDDNDHGDFLLWLL